MPLSFFYLISICSCFPLTIYWYWAKVLCSLMCLRKFEILWSYMYMGFFTLPKAFLSFFLFSAYLQINNKTNVITSPKDPNPPLVLGFSSSPHISDFIFVFFCFYVYFALKDLKPLHLSCVLWGSTSCEQCVSSSNLPHVGTRFSLNAHTRACVVPMWVECALCCH